MVQMTDQIRNHLESNASLSRKNIMINNFLGGISWGFGTVIGASIVAVIILSTLQAIDVFKILPQYLPDTPNVQIYK